MTRLLVQIGQLGPGARRTYHHSIWDTYDHAGYRSGKADFIRRTTEAGG